MINLITPADISKAIKLDKTGKFGTAIGWLLMRILKLNKINRFYADIKHLEGLDFINAIFDKLNIDFDIPEEDLKRIPKNAEFITVSNHPLGAIDGVLLLKLILEQRNDYKALASYLLERVAPLQPYLISVNDDKKKNISSIAGLKNALQHLQDGHPLGIFPAGEVSTYKDNRLVVDKTWDETALKLIYNAKVPIIPIYFHAKNSRFFYFLSKIHPVFKTAKLPSEVISKRKRTIKVRIGKPITPKMQKDFADYYMLGEFIRKKTYILAKTFEEKKLVKVVKKKESKPKSIIPPVSIEKLEKDIQVIMQNGDKMFEKNEYVGFLSDAKNIPNLLREIGRLREETFRMIGEGTGKEIDLDRYDKFYKHLILWDKDQKKIAGAYRMGLGREIFEHHGIKGFYLHELFDYDPELYNMMSKTIEMGRAFVSADYQLKPFPLFLLWRGIVHTTLRHPDHEYLMGPVSISDQFSDFSKSLIIEFMKSYFFDAYTAQYVKPKKPFKVKLDDKDKEFIFASAGENLNKFDKLIDELEPNNLKVPVLLKKYIKQNAKIVAFNVDPDFNDALDGLMYIKISNLPEDTVKPVLEEFEKQFNDEA